MLEFWIYSVLSPGRLVRRCPGPENPFVEMIGEPVTVSEEIKVFPIRAALLSVPLQSRQAIDGAAKASTARMDKSERLSIVSSPVEPDAAGVP